MEVNESGQDNQPEPSYNINVYRENNAVITKSRACKLKKTWTFCIKEIIE